VHQEEHIVRKCVLRREVERQHNGSLKEGESDKVAIQWGDKEFVVPLVSMVMLSEIGNMPKQA
jgi:hypothetical protein